MDDKARQDILDSALLHSIRESIPDEFVDPFFDMDPTEKSKLLIEQARMLASREEELRRERERYVEMQQSNAEMQQRLDAMTQAMLELSNKMSELVKELREERAGRQQAEETIASLREENNLLKKDKYAHKSQSSRRKKSDRGNDGPDRQQQKDDFDGTPESLGVDATASQQNTAPEAGAKSDASAPRLYRMGMAYRSMGADTYVEHHSDMGKLPQGAVVIEKRTVYAYDQETRIVEHRYESIRYKMPDGRILEGYFPADGEPEIIDRIPGTHCSSNFLAYLCYNKFVLDTPYYRELMRIMEEKMSTCRQTLINWIYKGHTLIGSAIVSRLKEICVSKDAIVNCDETWCRVKVEDRYRKRYIWCLVNRKDKIVIYLYEDGSRSRDTLKFILGEEPQIAALQSDGYNVYMYLDDEIYDVDHICCLAHARAKFKYASDIGGDGDARFFLDKIAELYKLEDEYEKGHLSDEQITLCRQSLKTKEIVGAILSKLDAMLSPDHPPVGDLMRKALNYLYNFRTQIFRYLEDGRYSIDNTVAERFIRPLAGERKNSLFFGSSKMAQASAAYHTLISTCKAQGLGVLDYLKRVFREYVYGNRDVESMLPLATATVN